MIGTVFWNKFKIIWFVYLVLQHWRSIQDEFNVSKNLLRKLDELGRWYWPDPDCECVRMMRRAGRFRMVLTAWLEEQIALWLIFLMM